MTQLVQVTGAVLILAGFALAQLKVLDVGSVRYLILNAVGSATLATTAFVEQQWGFVILNVAWSAIAAWSLLRVLRGRAATERTA